MFGRLPLKFLIITSATITVIFVLLFLWLSGRQEEHLMEQVRKQAIILHKQVVLTREWVSDHSAVLIPKNEGVESSPFLAEPDVRGADGRMYTKISPSIITRLLSERAEKSGLYSFKLTNTQPLNRSNAPDKLEAGVLERFRSGDRSGFFSTEQIAGKAVLRYVAPVEVSQSCIECHMTQGYKPGDVGGCLSVFVPMDAARSAINRNRAILLGGGMALAGSLVISLFVATRFMVFKRIGEIRNAMSRLTLSPSRAPAEANGDELKEIADFCYLLDERLKNQHRELEKKLADATRDLSNTNRNLEDANRELLRLIEAKSDFFSDISHELRTPLTSIKGAADLLRRKYAGEHLVYVDIIRRNTEHLIKVVIDFLDYSKIESGQLDLNITEGSLKTVAQDAILSQKAEAQKKFVDLALYADGEPRLAFDEQRIYQVLINLLSNAVRFSPEGGAVTVTITRCPDGSVVVAVEDEGPGIQEKYHTVVFEKFYQIPDDGDSKMHRGSAGIGLAICKGLVEAHGGSIWVQSEPGDGCQFFFALPNGD